MRITPEQTQTIVNTIRSVAQRLLGYAPTHRLAEGDVQAMPWYVTSKT